MAGDARCVDPLKTCKFTTEHFAAGWEMTLEKTSSPFASTVIELSTSFRDNHLRLRPMVPSRKNYLRKLGSAERVVVESEFLHFPRIIQIPAIDEQAAAHQVASFFPIEIPEYGPFRTDQGGVSAFQGFVRIIEIGNIWKEMFCPGDGLRIGGVHLRAFFDQAANYFQRGGEADVVRIGFEGQPENRDALPADHPESFVHFFEKAVDALLVDALGGFQHVELDAYRGGKVDEGLNVLRKAETPEAEAGLEELRADAGIEAHGVGDFLNVGADAFAEVGDDVGIADFQGEERVGCVLDEFGAADGGYEEFAAG